MNSPDISPLWFRVAKRAERTLRRALLPVFAVVNPGDVNIRHHYTGDPVRLHSFRHKGYWWHGKRRESESMRLFSELIGDGATVLEVGGHIGYISLYFAKLVGPKGAVHVFEPGPNNLPYLLRNVKARPNIVVVSKALGEHCGRESLFVENLTGQNNSFVPQFDGFEANQRNAFHVDAKAVDVEMLTLDSFVKANGVTPDFIKIDVEGFEYEVLSGAREFLAANKPRLMVEVQRRHDEVFSLLSGLGYFLFDEHRRRALGPKDVHLNTFCLHGQADAAAIRDVMHSEPSRPHANTS